MGKPDHNRRSLKLLLLSAGALLLVLTVAEITLRIINRPRFPQKHTETRRFLVTSLKFDEIPIYVNYPGTITFTYDGNPRGYFSAGDKIVHEVNPDGFRGRPFGKKQADIKRIVFLGDSFTFGEGVKLSDTYPEVTARYLNASGARAEACNLGVGGYNTTDSERLLKAYGLDLQPDAVVLGYTPNDAEPPLFNFDTPDGVPTRRNREATVLLEGTPLNPPDSPIYSLKIAQLIWRSIQQTRRSKQTIAYYKSTFEPESKTWRESERALREIIKICRDKDIPCVVVMFPLLYRLSDDYPLKDIHEQVGSVVTDAGGIFVDLLPALKGKKARDLWVHPTDQHPNERVHAVAAQLVAKALRKED